MSAVEFAPQSAGVINVEQSEAARHGHWSYNDKRPSSDFTQPHGGLSHFHVRGNIAVKGFRMTIKRTPLWRPRKPVDSVPSEFEKRSIETTASTPLKFSVLRLALAFVIAGLSDVVGAFASLAPPIEWAVDVVTAALLFVVLGWQWLLLPGLVLEAIPGVGVLPFWLLVVGAIAVLGTPRPNIGQR
jgi:hypothetical protein